MLTGSAYCSSIVGLSASEREAALLDAMYNNNLVALDWCEVIVTKRLRKLKLFVAHDVVAVGTADDFVRMPCNAYTAQKIADALGCVLPTACMVDAIWRASEVKLQPHPFTPPPGPDGKPYWDDAWCTYMMSVEALERHNAVVETQRAGRAGLIAGHKKDVVNTTRLSARAKQVAIYGWIHPGGMAIQPLSLVHEATYADYSHGERMVRADCELDGEVRSLAEIALDPMLHDMVSYEGPVSLRHPGVRAEDA